jgi:hypothetical protein
VQAQCEGARFWNFRVPVFARLVEPPHAAVETLTCPGNFVPRLICWDGKCGLAIPVGWAVAGKCCLPNN